jgi:hypothetical protein
VSLTEQLVQLIFGWQPIIITIFLSITGVALKKPLLLVIAGIVCLPFTYYISAGFRTPALLLPFFQFASAYAIMRQKNGIAWLLITPFITVSGMLAYFVLNQY